MRIGLIVLAVALTAAAAIPLIGGFFGDDSNEATRLVEATERTQEKAQAVSRSYNDVIPPVPPPAQKTVQQKPVNRPGLFGGQRTPSTALAANPTPETGASSHRPVVNPDTGEVTLIQTDAEGTPVVEPTPELSPGEHAVADAMIFLAEVQAQFNPGSTEYIRAVEQLKGAWAPRYARASEEFKRFEQRVRHAEEMGYDYLEIQQRLTENIQNPERRFRHEERDILEQDMVLNWINQANGVLSQARAIKADLDDMNLEITKLELSATFAAVYEGFMRMPIAISLLNRELARFEIETDRIYATFGPQAD